MYKLLLITDQDDVLDAFNQVGNWERTGFKYPHIRHDLEGTKDSLAKHHADGIAIAVSPEEEEKILAYLQEYYPTISIFKAGKTRQEVLRYLNELSILLNRLHADFSNDRFTWTDMLVECRHEFFRKVLNGKIHSPEELHRTMRLMRSRMDADRPCLLIQIAESASSDQLEGRWHEGADRLEVALRNSFAADLNGVHILPTVHEDGRILVLACPLHGVDVNMTVDDMTAMLTNHAAESINHMKDFFGVDLHITEIRVLPALTALCGGTDQINLHS
jgi:hypothetical protein